MVSPLFILVMWLVNMPLSPILILAKVFSHVSRSTSPPPPLFDSRDVIGQYAPLPFFYARKGDRSWLLPPPLFWSAQRWSVMTAPPSPFLISAKVIGHVSWSTYPSPPPLFLIHVMWLVNMPPSPFFKRAKRIGQHKGGGGGACWPIGHDPLPYFFPRYGYESPPPPILPLLFNFHPSQKVPGIPWHFCFCDF